MSTYILEMQNICKSFYNVQVLHDVQLAVRPGEVHALLGENGAGKSTLMKILTGIYTKDSGQILIDGKVCEINNPADARANEISIIHQEISVAPDMTVAENIFMGAFLTKGPLKLLDKKRMNTQAQVILEQLHMSIRPDDLVRHLSVAQQQMVEIAKAISMHAKIIVMDEPTSSLTETEVVGLMAQIRLLAKAGIAIIYISHRMEEIYQICDRLTVLRDGHYIGTAKTSQITHAQVIHMLVGRPMTQIFSERHPCCSNEIVLEASHLQNRYLKDISFSLKKGEILGFSGLVGAGRTELSRALFGIDPLHGGTISIDGQPVTIHQPIQAIDLGIGLVPEDRKQHGLLLEKSVAYNLTIAIIRRFIRHLRVNTKKQAEVVTQYKNALSIKMAGVDTLCKNLSGGNQQKVVISKWLAANPKILILDEPTRGIDVGAKSEIYKLINQLAESGISIMLISSELSEILNLCNRVVVMHEGEITAVLDNNDGHLTQEEVMYHSMGGHADAK